MKDKKMLGEMLKLATQAHTGQFDRGGLPYILHPIAVMNLLDSADEALMCIAIGHDLIEDTYVTEALLKSLFPARVVDAIVLLTKKPDQDYDEYLDRICRNKDAIKVKIADITHNSDLRRLKGVEKKDLERITKYHLAYVKLVSALLELDIKDKGVIDITT